MPPPELGWVTGPGALRRLSQGIRHLLVLTDKPNALGKEGERTRVSLEPTQNASRISWIGGYLNGSPCSAMHFSKTNNAF